MTQRRILYGVPSASELSCGSRLLIESRRRGNWRGLDNQECSGRSEHRIFHSSPSEPFPAGSSEGTLVISSSGGAMSVP
jgi:hypothetical protein